MLADTHTQTSAIAQRPGGGEQGMTIVEVMVATVILLVGVLGVLTLLDAGNRTTSRNLARGAAVSLAREQLERAREVSYASLTNVTGVATTLTSVVAGANPASLVTTVAPITPGAPPVPVATFTTTRLGTTYATTIATCVLDDPSDGIGPVAGTPCTPLAAGAGIGTVPVSVGSSSLLGLNVVGIPLTGTGSVVDVACSLVGRNATLDALLGSGSGLLGSPLTPLVSAGADTTFCGVGKGNVAFDRQAADTTAVTTVVTFTYPGTTRTGRVSQRVLVSGPRVTS